MNHFSRFTAALLLCCFSSLLFSQAAFSQDFSSIGSDLETLESLITDTLWNMEEQQKLLENLKRTLDESGNVIESYESIIAGHEDSLKSLQARLNEMSETYRTQSSLSAKYESSSRFWKTFTLIGIPSAALLSGTLVWTFMR